MVSVNITNTGRFAGKEVVQLYIRDLYARIVRPDKELKGFKKVEIKPGESKRVTFTITPDMLKYTSQDYKSVLEQGEFEVMVGSCSTNLQSSTFNYVQKKCKNI